MKTKTILLVIALLAFSSYTFSQETVEDTVEILSLTDYDYHIDKAEYPKVSDRKATFSKSLKYNSLGTFMNQHVQFPDDAR